MNKLIPIRHTDVAVALHPGHRCVGTSIVDRTDSAGMFGRNHVTNESNDGRTRRSHPNLPTQSVLVVSRKYVVDKKQVLTAAHGDPIIDIVVKDVVVQTNMTQPQSVTKTIKVDRSAPIAHDSVEAKDSAIGSKFCIGTR